eukprot:TRINITY_DN2444_c0_g1_i2.p1 TRINITY_DN2444_c0_g1~~TRINITY_DN2444_c0_g1_i2.p1  ORF type:complete len:224 (-),score=35.66 TRINITY_DN2444_c0_g1_i2:92-763(-)
MVVCDLCDEQFHCDCVGIFDPITDPKRYVCPTCESTEKDAQPGKKHKKRTTQSKTKKSVETPCTHCKVIMTTSLSRFCSRQCRLDSIASQVEVERYNFINGLADQIHFNYKPLVNEVMKMIRCDRERFTPISSDEEDDVSLLVEIDKEKFDLQRQKEDLLQLQSDLASNIAHVQSSSVVRLGTLKRAGKKRGFKWDKVDCFGCGQSFQSWKYPKHAITCFSKR